ncbi:LysR family transcriptional regulator [Marinomonas hwangdonensis]|uniref:LysR family transcriptional regulator n=1 Tax=Marinomonas hwangdonensis TaxID=1053647 RepID=A0A3M8PY35_9GAMM|nr:LysR family transcriptional regulator [Marinomonas hwangdonensis]
MNLDRFDFNQLYVFYVLYEERSLKHAAERMNLSQSAISHKLSGLRKTFNDPLFERKNRQMQPTLFSEKLVIEIEPIIKQLFSFYKKINDFRTIKSA